MGASLSSVTHSRGGGPKKEEKRVPEASHRGVAHPLCRRSDPLLARPHRRSWSNLAGGDRRLGRGDRVRHVLSLAAARVPATGRAGVEVLDAPTRGRAGAVHRRGAAVAAEGWRRRGGVIIGFWVVFVLSMIGL